MKSLIAVLTLGWLMVDRVHAHNDRPPGFDQSAVRCRWPLSLRLKCPRDRRKRRVLPVLVQRRARIIEQFDADTIFQF